MNTTYISHTGFHLESITRTESDAIITSDESRRILSWNAGAVNLFGYSASEAIGRPIDMLMPERYRDRHNDGMLRLSGGGAPRVLGRALDVEAVRKNGEEFPIELTLGMSRRDGRAAFSAIIRDVSERKAAERLLIEQKRIIEAERQKSEELLRNILPASIVAELKERGNVAPRLHPAATVLFTDIHAFTRIAERSTPENLVSALHRMFTNFDEIVHRRGLEKIKTIGDAYMCAGGIGESGDADDHHTVRMVLAAVEMQRFMRRCMPEWSIRVGVHVGPVIAGVVGRWKYAYDVWGDTVNIAARMEQHGIPGQINVSADVFARIGHLFTFQSRGAVSVYNKDDMMMYLLTGLRPEFRSGENSWRPNARFRKVLRNE